LSVAGQTEPPRSTSPRPRATDTEGRPQFCSITILSTDGTTNLKKYRTHHGRDNERLWIQQGSAVESSAAEVRRPQGTSGEGMGTLRCQPRRQAAGEPLAQAARRVPGCRYAIARHWREGVGDEEPGC